MRNDQRFTPPSVIVVVVVVVAVPLVEWGNDFNSMLAQKKGAAGTGAMFHDHQVDGG